MADQELIRLYRVREQSWHKMSNAQKARVRKVYDRYVAGPPSMNGLRAFCLAVAEEMNRPKGLEAI